MARPLLNISLECAPEKVPSSKRRFLVGAVPLCSSRRPSRATTAGDNPQPRFVDEEIAPTITTEPMLWLKAKLHLPAVAIFN
ncbi:MAG TPA: hypothetical protein V6C91_03665 [Coleofasciculaceae cyanobacterium]